MRLSDAAPRPDAKPELPPGWRPVRLGDVCKDDIENRDPRLEADKPFRYVDITSVDNLRKRIVSIRTLLGRDAPSRARQIIRSGDVIVSTTRPNLNAVAKIPPDLDGQICSTGFSVLRPKSDLDRNYLFAFVQSEEFVERLSALVRGALYPAVTDRQVRAQLIPLPPLAEQQRIAAILNEQMTAVEGARAAAEAQMDAAKVLPAAYLRAVFDSTDAQQWSRKCLGELTHEEDAFSDGPFGSNLKTEHYSSSGARVVRLQNIGRGVFLDEDKAFIPMDHYLNLFRHSVRPQDVVVAALGDGLRPAGRACMIPEGFGPGLVKADCFRVRLPAELIFAPYLVAFLNSPQSLLRTAEMMRGATRPRVTLGMLRNMGIPLPQVAEQRRIAETLGEQRTTAEKTRKALEEQRDAINALPGALLRRAFSGEL